MLYFLVHSYDYHIIHSRDLRGYCYDYSGSASTLDVYC